MSIEKLIDHSHIEEASELVEKKLENKELSEEEILNLLIQKSDITCLSGHCQEGLESSIELVKDCQRIGNSFLQIKALIQQATIMQRLRRFDESQKVLETAKLLLDDQKQRNDSEYKKTLASWYTLSGHFLILAKKFEKSLSHYDESIKLRKEIEYHNGIATNLIDIGLAYKKKIDFKKYHDYSKEALEIFTNEENKRMMGVALINMANAFIYEGDMKSAIKLNLQVLEIRKQMDKKINLFYTLNRIGGLYWRIGDLDKAFEYWNEGYALSSDVPDKRALYTSYTNFGLYYYELGNLEKSLEYQKKALERAREVHETRDVGYYIAERLTVIGYIYLRMGEYEKALSSIMEGQTFVPKKYHEFIKAENEKAFGIYYTAVGDYDKAEVFLDKAMEYYEAVQRPYDIYETLHYFGIIHYQKNNVENAIECLKKSLDMSQQMEDKVSISFNLFELVKIYSQIFDIENARFYQIQLTEIGQTSQLASIQQNVKLTEAAVLKMSENYRDRIKSETIFEQIIEEKSIWHSNTVYSILSLCELYLEDLRLEEEIEILDKIKKLVDYLLQISEEQNSPVLICETKWFRSQLAIFEFDSKKSLQLLAEAEKLASDKGLILLSKKYKTKLDSLEDSVKEWKNFASKTASISEIFEHTEIDKALNGLKKDISIFVHDLRKHSMDVEKNNSTELQLKQNL